VKTPWRLVLYAVWLSAAIAGTRILMTYESTPGAAGETPSTWPTNSTIPFHRGQPVLVMFAHPQCPCTRASIEELNRLMTRCENLAVRVLFTKPSSKSTDWTQSASWKNAEAISGVKVLVDPDGQEARRFGAESSGYVVVYDKEGHLLFHGGITAGRGLAGDNAGEKSISKLLSGEKPALTSTPVFGCRISDQCNSSLK
jgi:hypothetical protein